MIPLQIFLLLAFQDDMLSAPINDTLKMSTDVQAVCTRWKSEAPLFVWQLWGPDDSYVYINMMPLNYEWRPAKCVDEKQAPVWKVVSQ